jgi:hypothetical protein
MSSSSAMDELEEVSTPVSETEEDGNRDTAGLLRASSQVSILSESRMVLASIATTCVLTSRSKLLVHRGVTIECTCEGLSICFESSI